VLGISESVYAARFTSPTQTDWVMRCTPKKVLRTAEQEPVVLPPAKAQRGSPRLTKLGGMGPSAHPEIHRWYLSTSAGCETRLSPALYLLSENGTFGGAER
jgi:hypothetical protein